MEVSSMNNGLILRIYNRIVIRRVYLIDKNIPP